ncbi:DUF1211 domain-containing protein [Candidatus Micrarchaeota archaeon]|nr:DUF1211 domain-containing protein [Candidatus Micrarchaeota archaeon]
MADERTWLATARLEALTDGIFAFAMTLLVLSIMMPDDPGDNGYMPNATLREMLLHEWRMFLNYAIAFLLLASFWMNHSREFRMIKSTEHRHTWINIIFLMFVVLVPFTTDLIGDYSEDRISWFLFGANMFILGSLLCLNWWYVSRNRQLIQADVKQEHIEVGKRRGLLVPAISLISIGIAFFDTNLAGFAYLLIPVIMMLPFFHVKDYRRQMLTKKK